MLNAAGETEPCDQSVIARVPALGLSRDSILVLSSLAPGADQLVAEEALKLGLRVLAPLPFPLNFSADLAAGADCSGWNERYDAGLYRNLTTFIRPSASDQENRERQLQFQRIAYKLLRDDCFLVRIQGDWALGGEALAQKLATDAQTESARNLRYRAAGEYIASSCDLLIAICDESQKPAIVPADDSRHLPLIPDDSECGASAIVRTRLFGTTPELLPDISALTWADNGPVLRIWAENCGRTGGAAARRPLRLPATELWYPESSKFLSPLGPADEQNEQQQMLSLAQQVNRLRQLPARESSHELPFLQLTTRKHHKVRLTRLETLLQRGKQQLHRWRTISRKHGPSPVEAVESPTSQSLQASGRLCQLTLLYERANRSSLREDKTVKCMLSATPWLSLAGFLLLQFGDNLHLNAEIVGDSRWLLCLILAITLLLFFVPWIWRWRLRNSGSSENQENDRALAEALRVQFYWALAGVGKSTAQYYQQRERGELSWIRAVVSSAVIPVSGFQEEFERLQPEVQERRLQAVLNGWLRTQHSYFRRVAAEQNERLQGLTLVTRVMLTSGVGLLLLCSVPLRSLLEQILAGCPPVLVTMVAAGNVAGLAIWVLLSGLRLKLKNLRDRFHRQDVEYQLRKSAWVERCWQRVSRVLFCLACSVTLGVLLALSLVVLISSISSVPPLFSDSLTQFKTNLTIICRNMCFAASAVLATRISFHFLPQNVPRYQSMLALFRGASMRMEALLRRVHPQTSAEDRRRALHSVHALLEDLGAEALVENAEWLKMHRISPPTPLMPSP